ncbi:MAG TPA: hypothetical protein VMW91_02070 [Desulfosporosinus sp.]|nr:hypothetical protein [Desulfosporosinus sp.]
MKIWEVLNSPWFIGVLTGVVAAVVFSILVGVFSRGFRSGLLRLLLRVANAGMYEYFPTQRSATKAMRAIFRPARQIRILAVRAWSIFQVVSDLSEFGELIREKAESDEVRILLLCPFVGDGGKEISFLNVREGELNQIHPRNGAGIALSDQVKMTLKLLKSLKREGLNCSIKLYNELPVFKILIFDDHAFVGGFNTANVGRNNPVYHVRRNEGLLFDLAERYFEYIWRYRSYEYNLDLEAEDQIADGGKA